MPVDTVQVQVPGPVDTINLSTIGPQGPAVGGGSPMGIAGVAGYRMLTSDINIDTGKGTELIPLTWEVVEAGTYGPLGPAGSGDPPEMEIITAGDNSTMKFVQDGFYSITLSWVLVFPSSSPVIVGAYQWGGWLTPNSSTFHPVCPPRGTGSTHTANNWEFNSPHSVDHSVSPTFWAHGSADDYWTTRLWWNTDYATPTVEEVTMTVTRFAGGE